MQVEVKLEDVAVEAFKREVLDALTPEQREKLISDAISAILRADKRTHWTDRSFNFDNDVMRPAITKFVSEVVANLLKEEANRAKLEVAIQQAFDTFMEGFGDKFSQSIITAFFSES